MPTVRSRAAAIGLTVAIAAVGTSGRQLQPAEQPESAIVLRELDRGNRSQIREARQAVVRGEDEWARLWQLHAPTRPRPPVDFSREIVAGVFLGNQPTAGFAVEIADARLENGTAVLRFRSRRPASDAMTAQMLTSPYHLVALPSHPGDVRFEKLE
jgi:hypothetical protein